MEPTFRTSYSDIGDGGAALGWPCCAGIFALLLFTFWLWMLLDCLTRDFPGNDKIIWVMVVILLGPLGALICSVVGRNRALPK